MIGASIHLTIFTIRLQGAPCSLTSMEHCRWRPCRLGKDEDFEVKRWGSTGKGIIVISGWCKQIKNNDEMQRHRLCHCWYGGVAGAVKFVVEGATRSSQLSLPRNYVIVPQPPIPQRHPRVQCTCLFFCSF